MQADITMVLALLMKNEDIWLKMPSQQIFDEICHSLQLIGMEFDTMDGHSIQIISLEGKKEREKEAARQLAQLQAYQGQLAIHKQMMMMADSASLGKLMMDPEPEDKSSFSNKVRNFLSGSSR